MLGFNGVRTVVRGVDRIGGESQCRIKMAKFTGNSKASRLSPQRESDASLRFLRLFGEMASLLDDRGSMILSRGSVKMICKRMVKDI